MGVPVRDITYIAGLLEGEGCFSFKVSPRLDLLMKDRDVIVKMRNLMCPRTEVYEHKRRYNWSQQYRFSMQGNLAIQWMMTLYPLMGKRRKAKIAEIITLWKAMKNKNRVVITR